VEDQYEKSINEMKEKGLYKWIKDQR
jgi:hypothetical protein